eukprot:m.161580 g.161580  ORF g.161580 m.161580 type:complete len:733 (-) comp9867_c0_seq2:92-2290(-)
MARPAPTLERPRPYQQALIDLATEHSDSFIVPLPTGAGKTLIAHHWALTARKRHPHRCVVFIAPTVPLVAQQAEYFRVRGIGVTILYGGKPSSAAIWTAAANDAKVVVCTPMKFIMSLQQEHLSLASVSLMIFDECHHAVKRHPYNNICALLGESSVRPRVLGLSASPACGKSEAEAFQNLRTICGAYKARIAPLSDAMEKDLCLFVNRPEVVQVRMGEAPRAVRAVVDEILATAVILLRHRSVPTLRNSEGELLAGPGAVIDESTIMTAEFQEALDTAHARQASSNSKINDALSLLRAIEEIRHFSTVTDDNRASVLTRYCIDLTRLDGSPSPKLLQLKSLLAELGAAEPAKRTVVVFCKDRGDCVRVAECINDWSASPLFSWARAHHFLGHNNRSGEARMTMSEQRTILDRFRTGKINVLVATSVAEEGIDVPSVSLVVRLDDQMTTMNLVQSRGRARASESRYIVLVDDDKQDVVEGAICGEEWMLAAVRRLAKSGEVPDIDSTWGESDSDVRRHVQRLAAHGQARGGAGGVIDVVEGAGEDWVEVLTARCVQMDVADPEPSVEQLKGVEMRDKMGDTIIVDVFLCEILLRINGSVTQTAAVSLNQQRGLNLAARDALAMSHALQSDDDASEDECAPPPQWQPDVPVDDDYISLLNLWWQQVYRPAGFGSRGFRYYSARVGGPDQAPIWLALACLDDNNYFLGRTARSKKIAEQSAAREAYTQIVRERY